MYSACACQIII